VTEQIPSPIEVFASPIDNSDRADLGMASILGAGSWATLQPNQQRDLRVLGPRVNAWGGIELIEHAGLACFMVPVDLLIT
jgi:hypothetical protein